MSRAGPVSYAVVSVLAAAAGMVPGTAQGAVRGDYGDAADGARARYATSPGLIGRFPARARSNGARHTMPGPLRLGAGVTREGDSRQVDRDRDDDGFSATLRSCSRSTLTFLIDASRVPASLRSRGHVAYLNAWFDWNRDGDWGDRSRCGRRRVSEYRVQNLAIDLGSFAQDPLQTVQVRVRAGRQVENIWQRATLTLDQRVTSRVGRGRFSHGETEDYLSPAGGREEHFCDTEPWFVPVDHGDEEKVRFFTDLKSPSAKLLTDPLPQGVQVKDVTGGGATVQSTLKHRTQPGGFFGGGEWQFVTLTFRLSRGARSVEVRCHLVVIHEAFPPTPAPPGGEPPGTGPGPGATPGGGAQFTGFIDAGPNGFPMFRFMTTSDATGVRQLQFGYTVTCADGSKFSDTASNFMTQGAPLVIPVSAGRFSFNEGVSFANPAGQTRSGRLTITGTFTTARRAEGTVRLMFADPRFGTCDQGTLPWEATG